MQNNLFRKIPPSSAHLGFVCGCHMLLVRGAGGKRSALAGRFRKGESAHRRRRAPTPGGMELFICEACEPILLIYEYSWDAIVRRRKRVGFVGSGFVLVCGGGGGGGGRGRSRSNKKKRGDSHALASLGFGCSFHGTALIGQIVETTSRALRQPKID